MKIFILMISGFFFCLSNNAAADCKSDFLKRVDAVYSDPRADIYISFSLVEIPEFRDLLRCAEETQIVARKILKSAKADDKRKSIVVFSLQSLKEDDYISFVDYAIDMYINKKISDVVFENALFPGFEWNTFLAEHYSDPRVEILLDKVRKTELKNGYLEEIMSGRALENVIQMRIDGELPPQNETGTRRMKRGRE